MSFAPAPKYNGAKPLAAYDPTPGVEANVDVRFDATIGTFKGFIVGNVGTATPPEIGVYCLDGSILVIKEVQAGVVYDIPIRGVQSTSAAMYDIWGLV
jgi:hypothetical protein